MKMEIDIHADWVGGLMVTVLRQSVRNCCTPRPTNADDRRYAEKYRKAANFVIEHFGGAVVTD